MCSSVFTRLESMKKNKKQSSFPDVQFVKRSANDNFSSPPQLSQMTFYEHFAIRLRGFCRESNLWPPKLDQMKAQSRSKGRLSVAVIIMLIC